MTSKYKHSQNTSTWSDQWGYNTLDSLEVSVKGLSTQLLAYATDHVNFPSYDSQDVQQKTQTTKPKNLTNQPWLNRLLQHKPNNGFRLFYSVSQKKSAPPDFFLTFLPTRLGIFSPNFTCLLCVPIYAELQIFIRLLATLTKLRHIKRDHYYIAQNVHHWLKCMLGDRT